MVNHYDKSNQLTHYTYGAEDNKGKHLSFDFQNNEFHYFLMNEDGDIEYELMTGSMGNTVSLPNELLVPMAVGVIATYKDQIK